MSDISIPGVNSRFNTDQMIEDLMEAERIPQQRMETRVEEFENEQRIWQDTNRALSQFRDASRALFGASNPFGTRIANSSNETVLTATAARSAEESTNEVRVLQTATADRFLSSNLSQDLTIEGGEYTFRVGDNDFDVRFRGGDLQDLSRAINRAGEGILRTSVVRNTADTPVILFESQIEGAENRLLFEGDARDLAFELGLIEESNTNSHDVGLSPARLTSTGSNFNREAFSIQEGALRADPESQARIPVGLPFAVNEEMVLEYRVRLRELPSEDAEAEGPPPGPQIPQPEGARFSDIQVPGAGSQAPLPEWEPPEPPPVVQENQVLFLQGATGQTPLPDVPVGPSYQTVTIPLAELSNRPSGIDIVNTNTARVLEIADVRIYDPTATGDTRPTNALATASDARLSVDGIEITRSTNEVEDVIPGVTLNLRRESPEEVAITVGPDQEAIKDSLIEFVGYYNQLMRDINILTGTDPGVVQEIDYFTDEEREAALERLGALQGDSTLTQLKSRLRTIMMNAYPTEDPGLNVLAQVGISTNASGAGGGFDASRLRGYLEINESELDVAIERDVQSLQQLFGRDTDGDLVRDTGVAVEIDQYVRPYVQVGGILAARESGLDTQIGRTEDQIEDYGRRLERYETQLRRDFGQMEEAMNQMEESQRALQNLNNQGGGQQ